MTKQEFLNITSYIGNIINGTKWENHIYAVGGAVRDMHMGNDIKDIDIVIDLPRGGVEFANWCKDNGYTNTVVIYETYGTAMFKFNEFPDEEIECVMTRGEKYIDKDSRNPITEFADIYEDAIRRDLTINALYYNVSTKNTFDIVGGLQDIENHIITTTNKNPDIVFDDDPLRILRVVRFATRYGWAIEDTTYASMMKYVDRLEIITKERIQAEFNKILMSRNAVMGINILHNIGAMKYIIPEFEQCFGLKQNKYHIGDVAEHSLAVLDYHCKNFEPNIVERLACILHDIGKLKVVSTDENGKIHFYEHENASEPMVVDILKALKYDNDTIKEVKFIVKNHMRTKNWGDDAAKLKIKTLNKFIYDCKTYERFVSLMKVIEGDNLSHAEQAQIHGQYDALTKIAKESPLQNMMFGYKLPIDGNDIMSVLKLQAGPTVAMIHKRMLDKAFAKPDITREECIKILPIAKRELDTYLKFHHEH